MDEAIKHFRSNGKLLLTAEYLVLKGAKAIAIPLNTGQSLQIGKSTGDSLDWITFEKNIPVFTASYALPGLDITESNNTDKALYIQKVLNAARVLNPNFINKKGSIAAKANIEFDMSWGLGSSSTLISNIAQWAKVDALELNRLISKGSGYDIACAQQNTPIFYTLEKHNAIIQPANFNPPFLDKLNLVYLNKKMATEQNISVFLKSNELDKAVVDEISHISNQIVKCTRLSDFMTLVQKHEAIISNEINESTVKSKYFNDFEGQIKSLGAWGGDFALVASALPFAEQKNYFELKGYSTFFPLNDLLLNN